MPGSCGCPGVQVHWAPDSRLPGAGVPPLGVTAGSQTVSFAPDGSVTSSSLRGHLLVDLCAALS